MKPYRLYIKHDGLFIAYTPKVASTSIKTALDAKGSKLVYSTQIPEGSRVVGWIRDPMSRAVSCYNFLKGNKGLVREFNPEWSFDQFIQHVSLFPTGNQHWTPHSVLHSCITELYSYESLPVTFKEVTGVELPVMNSVQGTKSYPCDQKKFYSVYGRDQYLWEFKCIK